MTEQVRVNQLGAQDRLVWEAMNALRKSTYQATLAIHDSRKGADKRLLSALNEASEIIREVAIRMERLQGDS